MHRVHVYGIDNGGRHCRSRSWRVSVQGTSSCRWSSVVLGISCCGICTVTM